jgi:hypothetical protein
MSRGNLIVVNGDPRGRRIGGVIDDTSAPGTIMQINAGVAMTGGRHHWIAAAPGTDGKEVLKAVLLEDIKLGRTMTTAYAIGEHITLYHMLPGDEVNLLWGEVAGTGNTCAIGDRFIVDAESGLIVPESGSPQETFCIALEALTQQAGGTLLWTMII